jgi:hypothetical protein
MRRAISLAVLAASSALLPGDTKKPANGTVESDVFAEAHAPLFQEKKAGKLGALTERVSQAIAGAPATAAGHISRANFIDNFVFGHMDRDRIPHATLATDTEFLRRVSLDLTGRIPSSQQVRDFLADTDPGKRRRLVDSLIASEAFVDKWSYFFMDLLRANGKMGKGYLLFHYWMKENLASDRAYDDTVRAIITASAKSNSVVAAANLIVREHVEGKPGQPVDGEDLTKVHQQDTHDEISILFGKVFLGINLSCISCHDGRGHLEKVNVWLSKRKRSEFFQQAAFFGKTRYIPHVENTQAQMGHFIVDDLAPGYDTKGGTMLRVPRFGGPSNPAFILTGTAADPAAESRQQLARMLTSHPQFARATVNLFWAKLMGFGIVDPYDEFDLARQDPRNLQDGWQLQPSNPELLDALAADFRKHNHSIKRLFSVICNSNAYQLSARFPGQWQESYTPYYARKYVRMLTAEELHDSIALATGRPGSFKQGKQSMGMAMQLSVPQGSGDLKSFMTAFGQSNRSNPPRPPSPSPLQPLILMRSAVVTDRVLAEKDSRVQRLLDTYSDNGKVLEEMFLSTLSRTPSAGERELALSAMAANRVNGAQNLQWALINLVEFLYNY